MARLRGTQAFTVEAHRAITALLVATLVWSTTVRLKITRAFMAVAHRVIIQACNSIMAGAHLEVIRACTSEVVMVDHLRGTLVTPE